MKGKLDSAQEIKLSELNSKTRESKLTADEVTLYNKMAAKAATVKLEREEEI